MPCPNAATMFAQRVPSFGEKKFAIVAGTVTIVEANITGINTGHVHLHRQIGALSAVHFTADYAFCVLNRQSAFRVGYIHDERDNSHRYDQDNKYSPPGALCRIPVLGTLT